MMPNLFKEPFAQGWFDQKKGWNTMEYELVYGLPKADIVERGCNW